MTVSEKAKELVDKMYKVHSGSVSKITMYFAKQCALIAVDEILESLFSIDIEFSPNYLIQYYEQVKQEIEKL